MTELAYRVSGIHCGHIRSAVDDEVRQVTGVDAVEVDLATKLVTPCGDDLSDEVLREAIAAAGYEAEAV